MKRTSFWRLLIPFVLALMAVALPALAFAQEATPTVEVSDESVDGEIPQVHVVQEGENLTIIATTYGVTVEDILAINNLTNSDLLQIGQELIIPGGSGETVPTTYTVRAGDSIASIAAEFNTTAAALADQNRLIRLSPSLVGGQTIAVVSRTGSGTPRPLAGRPHLVAEGETLLSIAARYGVSVVELAAANGLEPSGYVFSGQRLRIPDESVTYRDLPDGWVDVQLRPQIAAQGSTMSIYVQNLMEGTPAGRLGEQILRFTPFGRGHVALVGLDAFAEPGLYPLEIGSEGDRLGRALELTVRLQPTEYDTQYIEVGEALDGLLDPELRSGEDAFLETIYADFDETQRWDGVFQLPLENVVVSAGYGGRRSYNGGPIEIYHTGVDMAAPVGTPVLAPAAGVVVFSDVLELRGLSLIIDHGLGIMTGYYHLSESLVEVGDEVVAGQPVASVGNSGLSSGPHLHWDLRIMDVPVNGLQWTEQAFP